MSGSRGTGGRRRVIVHAVRLALFAAIVVLIHRQYARLTAAKLSQPQAPIDISLVHRFFPTADSLDADGKEQIVRDASGDRLGSVLQTSPVSDHIIGFSGPTNVMIAIDSGGRILGVEILSSGDTRDHVRRVREDSSFLAALAGHTRDEASAIAKIDAVSGATLTSLAISEAVMQRLGARQSAGSLRFPNPPAFTDAGRLFPSAAALSQDETRPVWWIVKSAQGEKIGSILRTSPASDNIVGYQGPTEAYVGFDNTGRVIGVSLGASFDNEPYVTYVRDDDYFLALFNDLDIEKLADLDLQQAGVEGVSGATMTSMALAEALVRAAQHEQAAQLAAAAEQRRSRWNIGAHDCGTAAVIVAGLVIGLTRLRARHTVRIALQLVLIAYLGLTAGNLLSMAMFVGWAQHGIAWRTAPGLVLLAAAALLIPITTRRNIYCSHLCPHGAAQDLLKRRLSRQWQLPKCAARALILLPALLLVWCVAVGMLSLPVSLVDIEPFDAWVFRVAGWATITIAVVGLVASLFIPMAYCRYGCPTGALLKFLRYHSHSDRWTARDWITVGLLGLAMCLLWT